LAIHHTPSSTLQTGKNEAKMNFPVATAELTQVKLREDVVVIDKMSENKPNGSSKSEEEDEEDDNEDEDDDDEEDDDESGSEKNSPPAKKTVINPPWIQSGKRIK
jgi:hypothetical protein